MAGCRFGARQFFFVWHEDLAGGSLHDMSFSSFFCCLRLSDTEVQGNNLEATGLKIKLPAAIGLGGCLESGAMSLTNQLAQIHGQFVKASPAVLQHGTEEQKANFSQALESLRQMHQGVAWCRLCVMCSRFGVQGPLCIAS